jgi:hypothetical protein
MQEIEMKCMVCGAMHVTFGYGPVGQTKMVCGECNEVFEGVFNGDQPTFYALYTREPALLAAHEKDHDSTRVISHGVLDKDAYGILCGCPRDETRWNKEHN